MDRPISSTTLQKALHLPRIGVYAGQFGTLPARALREAIAGLEELGFGMVWYGEGLDGREGMSLGALLVEATETMFVGSGIANIYARDPAAMMNGARTLAEASDGRFILGIGVSHAPLVEPRGHSYQRPRSDMVHYLDAIERLPDSVLSVGEDPPIVLGALGHRMLRLAATRTAGAHTFLCPVSHTHNARSLMSSNAFLAPEQMVVLETESNRARAIARAALSPYLARPNYQNMLKTEGFDDTDLTTLSDSLVDALVAWGDEASCFDRVAEHLDAGADHVAIQVVTESREEFPLRSYSALSNGLAAFSDGLGGASVSLKAP